jgi:hypothetical protein
MFYIIIYKFTLLDGNSKLYNYLKFLRHSFFITDYYTKFIRIVFLSHYVGGGVLK